MKLAIVQSKPRKGDLAANLERTEAIFAQLASGDPDLVVLPEAALTGYFLEGAVYDLALSSADLAARIATAWRRASGGRSTEICIGFFENAEGTYYNAALYLRVDRDRHEVVHVHRKMFLPTYGVFDEERFLSRGNRLQAFSGPLGRAAILICEDAWHAIMPTIAAVKGARLIIVPSASPGRGLLSEDGELESVARWHGLLAGYAREHGVYIAYAGLAGFEGGKGMTGSSCVIDPQGRRIASGSLLGEEIVTAELDEKEIDIARASLPLLGDLAAVLPDLLLDDELLPGLAVRTGGGDR